jgi:hypothetical protein
MNQKILTPSRSESLGARLEAEANRLKNLGLSNATQNSEAGQKMKHHGGHGERAVGVKACMIPGCTNKIHARNLCSSHYDRWWRYGDVMAHIPLKFVREGRIIQADGVDVFEVPLTRGFSTTLNLEDKHFAVGHNWFAMPGDNTFYAVRLVGGVHVYLHRVILNAPDDLDVDHKNRNGLDNRRCNLRLATISQNGANRALPANKTSKYRGVSIYRPRNVWQAQFKINGRNQGLGHFHNEEEAARAYDAMARKHFGEFAQLNFP